MIIYPDANYVSFVSVEDAVICVSMQDPNNEFLKMDKENKEAMLIKHTNLLLSVCFMPAEEDDICGCEKPAYCDFKKALCSMILYDCDRGCCRDVKSFDNGVTKTEYFDKGKTYLEDKIPMEAMPYIKNCIKLDYRETILWSM